MGLDQPLEGLCMNLFAEGGSPQKKKKKTWSTLSVPDDAIAYAPAAVSFPGSTGPGSDSVEVRQ